MGFFTFKKHVNIRRTKKVQGYVQDVNLILLKPYYAMLSVMSFMHKLCEIAL